MSAGHGPAHGATQATGAFMMGDHTQPIGTRGSSTTARSLRGGACCTDATTARAYGQTICGSAQRLITPATWLGRVVAEAGREAKPTGGRSSRTHLCAKSARHASRVLCSPCGTGLARRSSRSFASSRRGRTLSSEIAAKRLAQEVLPFGEKL